MNAGADNFASVSEAGSAGRRSVGRVVPMDSSHKNLKSIEDNNDSCTGDAWETGRPEKVSLEVSYIILRTRERSDTIRSELAKSRPASVASEQQLRYEESYLAVHDLPQHDLSLKRLSTSSSRTSASIAAGLSESTEV